MLCMYFLQFCPTGWFTCQNSTIKCVELSFTCDCSPECDDASDEMPDFAGCDPVAAQACFAAAPGKQQTYMYIERTIVFLMDRPFFHIFFYYEKSVFFFHFVAKVLFENCSFMLFILFCFASYRPRYIFYKIWRQRI